MMSNDRSSGQGGLFPGIGGQYGAGAGMGQLSPYLNIDPSYLNQSQPEYLFNTETKRGNFEKSFSAIGSSVIVGSAVGGTFGFFDGIRKTANEQKAGIRRTQIMNYTLKRGGLIGSALGTIAVSYSVLYCLGGNVPLIEESEEAKSIISGTLTGLFFKSTSGLQKCARGGLIGFGVSTVWALMLKKQDAVQHYI